MSSWIDQLPYLVPVWHSVATSSLWKTYQNTMDLNLDIDFGGIGMFNDVYHKKCQRLNYRITRPPLPFFVEPSRDFSKFSGKNCLAISAQRNVLFSSKFNKINGFRLEIDEERFGPVAGEGDSNCQHQFSVNEKSDVNPFGHSVVNISAFTGTALFTSSGVMLITSVSFCRFHKSKFCRLEDLRRWRQHGVDCSIAQHTADL